MNKYLILFLVAVVCVSIPVIYAQQPDPKGIVDKPVTTSAWWDSLKVTRKNLGTTTAGGEMATALGISQYTTYNILQSLYNHILSNQNWAGSNLLLQDVKSFLDRFPSGSEVFQMTLNSGDTSYTNEYGEVYNAQEVENYYSTDLAVSNTYTYNYYVGRNGTTSDDNLETQLEITTNKHKYVINTYGSTTPLVLDMDGNSELDVTGGDWMPHPRVKDTPLVAFDINGDGFEELVEWLGAKDGLLLVYRKGEKVTGKNLFGNAGGFANGYEKLAALDQNKDHQLTGEELSTLSVWQDKNGNAQVDSEEVASVKDLGITSISTQHYQLVSNFVQDGQKKKMWDWNPVMMLVKKEK